MWNMKCEIQCVRLCIPITRLSSVLSKLWRCHVDMNIQPRVITKYDSDKTYKNKTNPDDWWETWQCKHKNIFSECKYKNKFLSANNNVKFPEPLKGNASSPDLSDTMLSRKLTKCSIVTWLYKMRHAIRYDLDSRNNSFQNMMCVKAVVKNTKICINVAIIFKTVNIVRSL